MYLNEPYEIYIYQPFNKSPTPFYCHRFRKNEAHHVKVYFIISSQCARHTIICNIYTNIYICQQARHLFMYS